MGKLLDQAPKVQPHPKIKRRAGAREVLTEDLAKRIALMVQQFPDARIAVTWDNVVRQTKLRIGHEFRRNVLATKQWNGRKLIADAFHDAKKIQRRLARDMEPMYANEPRSRLRLVIARLQAENLALREQLELVRTMQYDEIHALLDTRTPLNQLVALRECHSKSCR
ncbi:hypothetical protein [Comamonas thiooxydans]|nr:hypothetical protein [Comamonas thiooxydans]